jgi:AraC-like DNA-binding protein
MRKRRRKPNYISTQVIEGRYAFPARDARLRKGFHVVAVGCEHCRSDYRIERADFPYHCLEFVLEGLGTFAAKGKTHSLVPATLFTYAPGMRHTITCRPDKPMTKYFVDFSGPGAGDLLHDAGLNAGGVFHASLPQRLVDTFELLLRNGTEHRALTERLCANLVEYLVLKAGETRLAPGSVQSRAYTTYLRCGLVMREQWMTLRNLSDIARACHVAPEYVCRLFKRFDRESPHQRLMRMKISRAAERLTASALLIKEIAYEFGYEDAYHFSKTFKKIYGLSPEAFRRRGMRG